MIFSALLFVVFPFVGRFFVVVVHFFFWNFHQDIEPELDDGRRSLTNPEPECFSFLAFSFFLSFFFIVFSLSLSLSLSLLRDP